MMFTMVTAGVAGAPDVPGTGAPPREIGVAIGLPHEVAAELRGWRARFGDPAATAIIPHVTLVGPTVLDAAQLPAVVGHLARVAALGRPFRARLLGTGTFRPTTPVVYLALARGGAHCEALEAAVRSGPLAFPRRFGYHAHVTVAQDVPDSALDVAQERLADYDASFDVRSFGLYERGRTGWAVLREFFLGAEAERPASAPSPAAAPA